MLPLYAIILILVTLVIYLTYRLHQATIVETPTVSIPVVQSYEPLSLKNLPYGYIAVFMESGKISMFPVEEQLSSTLTNLDFDGQIVQVMVNHCHLDLVNSKDEIIRTVWTESRTIKDNIKSLTFYPKDATYIAPTEPDNHVPFSVVNVPPGFFAIENHNKTLIVMPAGETIMPGTPVKRVYGRNVELIAKGVYDMSVKTSGTYTSDVQLGVNLESVSGKAFTLSA